MKCRLIGCEKELKDQNDIFCSEECKNLYFMDDI